MSNTKDINIPSSTTIFELMNDFQTSMKDLRRLVTTQLLQQKIKRNNNKKSFIKILKGVNKYE